MNYKVKSNTPSVSSAERKRNALINIIEEADACQIAKLYAIAHRMCREKKRKNVPNKCSEIY